MTDGRPGRSASGGREADPTARKGWGGVTRKGAEALGEARTASEEWRRAAELGRRETEDRHIRPAEAWEPERWDEEPDERDRRPGRDIEPFTAPKETRAPTMARRPAVGAPAGRVRRKPRELPDEVTGELAAVTGPRRSPRLARQLTLAAESYEAGRYQDAVKLLRPLAESAPDAAGIRELYGLTLYRLGRWKSARGELDAYHTLTGSVDQYPVVADCERAMGRHSAVDERWRQLKEASPGVEVLAEGRLVVAGSLADRGRLAEAVALLERFGADRSHPKDWHLRTWYALADLYERAGDVPRARALFRRLVERDAGFFDAAERLTTLR